MKTEIFCGSFTREGKFHLLGANSVTPAAYRRSRVSVGDNRVAYCGKVSFGPVEAIAVSDFKTIANRCPECCACFQMTTSLFVNTPVDRLVESVGASLVTMLSGSETAELRLTFPDPVFVYMHEDRKIELGYDPAPFRMKTVGDRFSPERLVGEARSIAAKIAEKLRTA